MRVSKNHIVYPRTQIIKVLRTLNELVVSLDRLGSTEMTKGEHDSAVADFIQRHISIGQHRVKTGVERHVHIERAHMFQRAEHMQDALVGHISPSRRHGGAYTRP